jgi:hypothetical protein
MRLPRPLRAVALVALAALAPRGAAADDSSRHCTRGDANDTALRQGRYEGRWSQTVKATRPIKSSVMTQLYLAQGTFQLQVDRASDGTDHSSLTGSMETSLEARMPMQVGEAGAQRMGGGRMRLGELGFGLFTATVAGSESGELYSPYRRDAQAGAGNAVVSFRVQKATCDEATGTVSMDLMEQTAKTLEGGGFKVELPPASWELKRVDGLDEPRKRLKAELEQAPPAGIVQTPEREGRRLAGIADRIRKESPELWECLFETWAAHAEKHFADRISTEAAKLRGYQGDWDGLLDHVRRGLEASRGLTLVGRDTCSQGMHQTLLDAVGGAMARYLDRMAQGQAAAQPLLVALKQAELLGQVAPPLGERVRASLRAQARQLADAAYQAFRSARAAARARGDGKGGKAPPDPAVEAARRHAFDAAKSARLLEVEVPWLDDLLVG